jgi:ribonuclease PH
MNIGIRKSMVTGGKEITVETGKLAKQADGSVVVRMGDTMLLATVVSAPDRFPSVNSRLQRKIRCSRALPGWILPS